MEHYVYRLSDDTVPVVIISLGPLPPLGALSRRTVRELIGVYDTITKARDAASKAREANRCLPMGG